ncbi:vesicle-associated protein 1-1-like isoform X2 [Magnolia sinica]|uniref:vesicle-associated protein 1-1-like isoform X2 n=1 Tax=Magnolia sinica TaxID=86752 RepID=UPI002658C852|nr:vesicle-associated protein 1-1-like isoform X2 [Magnolia sinica]
MAFGELLGIEPQELKFPFELNKQISCPLQLSNKTDNYVAFKVKTTNPKKYCVRPNAGIVMPQSTCDVTVVMQGQREAPPDMRCKDKFLLQSVVANPGMIAKDITPEMFNKESGNLVEECKLRVVYVAPLQLPSPVMEGSDEDSSPPRASSLDNRNSNALDFSHVSLEPQDKSSEELLRREGNKRRGGFSFLYVMLIGLVGFLFGYLFRT